MVFIERRRSRRVAITGEFEFIKISTKKEVINKGEFVDQSALGVGVKTDFPLIKGQPVIIRPANDEDNLMYGVVCWCRWFDHHYRSGIRYILLNNKREVNCNGD